MTLQMPKRGRPIRCNGRRPSPAISFLAIVVSLSLTSPQDSRAALGERFLKAKMAMPAPSAAKDLCRKYHWACSDSGANSRLTETDIKLVHRINRRVNRQIREVSDRSQYRKADYWTLPISSRGDCEDFALLKKQLLTKAGIAPERLLLATVLDRNRNGHAVLILRTENGDFVLDNVTDKIKNWQSTRYTFLRMQNPDAPRKWIGLMVRG